MAALPETVALLSGLHFHSYFYVSSAALLIYDYCLTLDREISLIWAAPWTLVKVLFVLARYSAFIDITTILYDQFAFNISPGACRAAILLAGWMHIFGIAVSEAILLFRTWALWDCRKRLAIVFSAVFFVAAILVVTAEVLWMKSLMYGRIDIGLVPGSRCYKLMGSSILMINFLVVIFLESLVLILTVIRMVQQRRLSGNRGTFNGVVRVLYRDGIIFFVYMFGISLVNLFFVPLGSDTAKDILVDTQRVLHSVLSVRILLNLREAHQRDTGETSSTAVTMYRSSPVMFASTAHSVAVKRLVFDW